MIDAFINFYGIISNFQHVIYINRPKHNNKMKTIEAQTFPDLESRSEFGGQFNSVKNKDFVTSPDLNI